MNTIQNAFGLTPTAQQTNFYQETPAAAQASSNRAPTTLQVPRVKVGGGAHHRKVTIIDPTAEATQEGDPEGPRVPPEHHHDQHHQQHRQRRPQQEPAEENFDDILRDICGDSAEDFENVYEPTFCRTRSEDETTCTTKPVFTDGDTTANDTDSHQDIERPVRRRDAKFFDKNKVTCQGCHMNFWKLEDTEIQICHNCVKIREAIFQNVERNNGTVEIRHQVEALIFVIGCAQGHTWENTFRAKQGRKWCKQCRVQQRAERKHEAREQERQEDERLAREQERIFEQAQQQFQQQIIEEVKQEHQPVPEDPDVRFIQQVIDQIIAQNNDEHQEWAQADLDRLVDAFINIDERQVQHIFDQIAEEQQARVARRIRFMLHPDKNHNDRAKDAFQKFNNYSWLKRLKSSSSRLLSSSLHLMMNIIEIPVQHFVEVAVAA